MGQSAGKESQTRKASSRLSASCRASPRTRLELPGFQTLVSTARINAGSSRTLTLQMSIASLQESIAAEAAPPRDAERRRGVVGGVAGGISGAAVGAQRTSTRATGTRRRGALAASDTAAVSMAGRRIVLCNRREPVPPRLGRSALDVLDRRRHRVVRQRAPLPERRLAAAADAVRIEEMINYFDYDYPAAAGDAPFSVTTELAGARGIRSIGWCASACRAASCRTDDLPPQPGVPDRRVRLDAASRQAAAGATRCACSPTTQRARSRRDRRLRRATGLVLPSTPGRTTWPIHRALDELEAGGSTNGGAGHSAGLPHRARALHPRRHQPRHPRHRRRLQRRRHRVKASWCG